MICLEVKDTLWGAKTDMTNIQKFRSDVVRPHWIECGLRKCPPMNLPVRNTKKIQRKMPYLFIYVEMWSIVSFLSSFQKKASSSWRVNRWSAASQWIAPTWCWATASGPRAVCSGSGSPSIASSIWAPAPVWGSICRTRRSPSARLDATPLSLYCGGAAVEKYCRGLPSGRWLWLDVWWW